MNVYPESYKVSVTAGFTDLNGEPVVLTSLNAALYDGEDQLIVDFGSLPFVQADGAKEIQIPAAFNELGIDELEASRILRIELVTAAGTIRRSFSYVIAGEVRLGIMINSFMTMEAAELLVRSTPNVSGWNAASSDQRYAALIEAYNRLTRLPMKFRASTDDRILSPRDEALYRTEVVITRNTWAELTEDDYVAFPSIFRKALRAAQLIEANEILEGDSVGRKHRDGVISETIGESSVSLRAGTIDYGTSTLALKALAGFIYFNYRVVRG